MRKLLAAILFVAFLWSLPASANEEKLEGSWLVVQMVREGKKVAIPTGTRMLMTFRVAKHRWRFVATTKDGARQEEQGSWQLHGEKLTTRTDDNRKVEQILVRFHGSVIEFVKNDGTLTLEKQE